MGSEGSQNWRKFSKFWRCLRKLVQKHENNQKFYCIRRFIGGAPPEASGIFRFFHKFLLRTLIVYQNAVAGPLVPCKTSWQMRHGVLRQSAPNAGEIFKCLANFCKISMKILIKFNWQSNSSATFDFDVLK